MGTRLFAAEAAAKNPVNVAGVGIGMLGFVQLRKLVRLGGGHDQARGL
jgi:hypothetical protein